MKLLFIENEEEHEYLYYFMSSLGKRQTNDEIITNESLKN
jgi:hypothetical protein